MHGTAARRLLEQHFGLLADVAGIERRGLLVAERQQPFAAQLLLALVDNVGNLQCRRARPLRIGEHVELRDGQLREQLEGLFETLRRLAAATHHHVNTDKGVGHGRLHPPYLVGKQLAVIVAVHQAQHCVAATLQRHVEMGHEGTALGAVADQLVAHQVGLQAADAVAADALHAVQRLHQVDEALARGLAEVADVHARQHNLLAALARGLFGLRHQRRYRRVATEATGVGYGAVGAEVVAAVLHLQEVACAVAARTARGERPDVLRLLNIIW